MNPLTTSQLGWSRHATKRARQRAITNTEARLIITHGDRMKRVGPWTVAVSMTSRVAQELAADGTIVPADIPRLSRLVVLVGRGDYAIVTVAWLYGRRSRAYTRDATIH